MSSFLTKKILTYIFKRFEVESVGYCVLRGYETLPDKVENDVDIYVDNVDKAINIGSTCISGSC